MEETRSLTNLFLDLSSDIFVNLEHSMRVGDSIGGHYVYGHVVGTAVIDQIKIKPDGSRDLWINLDSLSPPEGTFVHKGSISIDGASLTIAQIQYNRFRVSLIPHTLNHTNLSKRKIGDLVNIEFHSNPIHTSKETPLTDTDYMLQAVEISEKGLFSAPPNPHVGCVIVNNGVIIGRGFHQKPGTPHAEINAIIDAENSGNSSLLAGSTVYVTLEPCHHFGLTGPCDVQLINRKVSRVVIGLEDPDTKVSGEGIKNLRSNGIEILLGVCAWEVEKSIRSYLVHRRTGIPRVVAKVALSLDGKIACKDGSSKWITGEIARRDVHKLRSTCQAIIVGSGTALADDPILNVRGIGVEVKPLRVVLDSKGRVTSGNLMDKSLGPTLIFTGPECQEQTKMYWKSKNVEFVCISNSKGGLDLHQVLKELGKRGVLQVLVEGGSQIHSSFIKQNLVDSLVLYYGSCLIGITGRSWMHEVFAESMNDVTFWEMERAQQFGNDLKVEYTKF
eukprot:TRINITY_DN6166_c0_g1_i2.p1 TRINITY_DN6166_c0_g1~~TRINITY_DN6166_c0_g1_i2.p1  ORF type:complete len:502 (-),score=60.20 TRINITY_DN6166_c0_g1_i2:39-1544(-)